MSVLISRLGNLLDKRMATDLDFVDYVIETATLAPELPQGPPYPGAKDYPIADELLDDPDLLRRLIEATAALMPPPKPKKPAKVRVASN
jgi:hypothetical protein